MTEPFFSRLAKQQATLGTKLCLGLDPHVGGLPGWFGDEYRRSPSQFLENFVGSLLRVAAKRVACVKFQSAFYEAQGEVGMRILKDAIQTARSLGLMVLLDAKRCDISTSMAAYGEAAFDRLGADALTVVPYMGPSVVESLRPWLEKGCGTFVVWRSSNADAGEWQERVETPILDFVESFQQSCPASIGLVAGATIADSIDSETWQRAANLPLLMPGVGPQGAGSSDRIQAILESRVAHMLPLQRGVSGFGDPSQQSALAELAGWDDYEASCLERLASYLESFGA